MRLLVFIRLVDGQGSGRGVCGLDPARHPVIWRPLGAAGEILLKDLPHEETLFGFGGVQRVQIYRLFQLRVIHLKRKKKNSRKG